jgi:hypothetical protein
MLIIDAMRRADTAQEICFLLTSYVETLQFYDAAEHLPAAVTALPVRGLDDIAARLAGLQDMRRLEPARMPLGTDCAMIDEAANLFREALLRLDALDVPDAAHFCFERRATDRAGRGLNV